MPLWIISIIARTGIPSRFQRLAAWLTILALIVLAIVGIRAAWHAHNANVAETAVRVDRADAVAEATNRVLAADREATANDMVRREQASENDKEIDREAAKGDDRAVGPGTASVLARMREQQAAGRR